MSKSIKEIITENPYIEAISFYAASSVLICHFNNEIILKIWYKSDIESEVHKMHQIEHVVSYVLILGFPFVLLFTYLQRGEFQKSKTHKRNTTVAFSPLIKFIIVLFSLTYVTMFGSVLWDPVKNDIYKKPEILNLDSLNNDHKKPILKTEPLRISSIPKRKYLSKSDEKKFGEIAIDDHTNASIIIESINTFGKAKGTINLPDTVIHDERLVAGSRWNFKLNKKSYTLTILNINPHANTFQTQLNEN